MNKEALEFIDKINNYWIKNNQVGRPFWERSAYNIGALAAYDVTKNEEYLAYILKWCEENNWQGHPDKGPKEQWTWRYGEENTKDALFADWHACFQVYLDVYQLSEDKDEKILKNVFEVINYQISTLTDSYWWWADGLFMGMSVFTKLYQLTQDVRYLDKLHEYFTFALELMYDGENGIRTSEDGYTSSAYYGSPYGGKKVVSSNFSDAANFTNLFYRDANFAYPVNPLPGELATTKNFWARGNGWVLASLARVLRELPKEWPHYHFYLKIFQDMAKAVKDCQKIDRQNNGFWTQSMLAHTFSCSEKNPEGYETSGTVFFTFGLLAGIRDGHLSKDEYWETAMRGWQYLTKVATHDNGFVGYVQWVGGAAGKAAEYDNTQDFAVGACLLAAAELSKFSGE